MLNKIVQGLFSRWLAHVAATGRGGLWPFGVPEKDLGMCLTCPFCQQPSFSFGSTEIRDPPSPTRRVRALVPTPSPGLASSSQPVRFVSWESFKAPRRNWCLFPPSPGWVRQACPCACDSSLAAQPGSGGDPGGLPSSRWAMLVSGGLIHRSQRRDRRLRAVGALSVSPKGLTSRLSSTCSSTWLGSTGCSGLGFKALRSPPQPAAAFPP